VVVFFCFGVLFTPIRMPALKNITITVPQGSTTHGAPGYLCTPASWMDIIIFYLGNYIAHVATVRTSFPPDHFQDAVDLLFVLFYPALALERSAGMFMTMAVFGKTRLQTAARAGALCMVVRSDDWKPACGDKFKFAIIEDYVHKQAQEGASGLAIRQVISS
jgi:hypothetical protein